jgi:HemY protein
MYRIVLFLLLIALASAGAAWIAEQPGEVVMSWGPWRATMTLPTFVLALGIAIVAAMLLWTVIVALWRLPKTLKHRRRERRHARGRHAITHGLLAIGHGDATAARAHAAIARKHADQDPLTLLLHAQSAQLDGDRERARLAFRAMAERPDTRLLGLRGLFVESQRAEDSVGAVMIAEEALKLSPGSTWASHAVLGYRCAKGDWDGAMAILDSSLASGLIDKPTYKRQRGVLLTARALELEKLDRDLSRESAMAAVKLAPTLVPAAVLAAKYESEAHQTRRAMRIIETAWLAQPHPELAEAYAHVRLGDSARQRLARIETLVARSPGHLESGLAVARAAIDASDFAKARAALEPYLEAPTQRTAILMAEIERTEHGDSGRARAWTLRAVRAKHDPVWTADGYVSDRWRPVSPVTGRLDAFQWTTALASLPSDRSAAIEAEEFSKEFNKELNAALSPPILAPRQVEPPREPPIEPIPPAEVSLAPPAHQDNVPAPAASVAAALPAEIEPSVPAVAAAGPVPAAAPDQPPAALPLFFRRGNPAKEVVTDTPKESPKEGPKEGPQESPKESRKDSPMDGGPKDVPRPAAGVAPVIPIVRPPDDPGIDETAGAEFSEQDHPANGQASRWRGFLTRWGQ